MSTPWPTRKARLGTLLQSAGDEDADGRTLDGILHGQSVIGKTAKTSEVDALRFTDRDLSIVGTLEYGQFAVIDVVNCNIDGRVYVRKSIEKRFALKTRDQCNPQLERDLLLRARLAVSPFAPHLLCAFQTPTHLNLVMEYAPGGTLWDVLSSAPLEYIPEDDLRWWAPQAAAALSWCHAQGIAHRDVKPHNFVVTEAARVQLIDFGSAAPLGEHRADGSRLVEKRCCVVPCGTCDYISPEVLQAHEAALVAMEVEEEEEDDKLGGGDSKYATAYGVETDWWSMGAMLYELAYGVAPFFAKDIRTTYLKIVDHRRSLKFKRNIALSVELEDLLRRLLTDADLRLGRHGFQEIQDHAFFAGTKWDNLHTQTHPDDLHLPIFAYNDEAPPEQVAPMLDASHTSTASHSQGFAFSAFFQPSENSSPALSILRSAAKPSRSILREQAASFFVGFSWGPPLDAFPTAPSPARDSLSPPSLDPHHPQHLTPRPARTTLPNATPTPFRTLSASTPLRYPFATPLRPALHTPHAMATLPRPSTLRHTAPRRAVSDREAMRQLVDCIGLSARKKVIASGRTPRTPAGTLQRGTAKELRFVPAPIDILSGQAFGDQLAVNGYGADSDASGVGGFSLMSSLPDVDADSVRGDGTESGTTTGSESDGIPPSPSPSPRPGSAMSMLSRRSTTPTTATATGTWSLRLPPGWSGQNVSRRSTSPPHAQATRSRRSSSPPPVQVTGMNRRSSSPSLVYSAVRRRSSSPVSVMADTHKSDAPRKTLEVPHNPYMPKVEKRLRVPRTTVPSQEKDVRSSQQERRVEKGADDTLGALEARYEHLLNDIKNIEARLGGSVRSPSHYR
ncbi:kinase-like protein [Auriscalpium vulgare]|uniref:Kinase-like protein n=1 Tax=Auriscalpium vulgare TaxID=40419 RepID=A0ACB8SBL6_9AGAM|nr:kinase-like protein [Auriscalpium vulgare]